LNRRSRLEKALKGAKFVGVFLRWLDAVPHPSLVCEIARGHVAAARQPHRRLGSERFAVELVPEGAVVPSPVEPNVADAAAVGEALDRVLGRVDGHSQELALLVPDQVVRVFHLQFDTFPRRVQEAVPLIRWRLRKSVPFDVEETVVSYLLQAAPREGVEVLAAVARQGIVRQYEDLVKAQGFAPGIVLSSTLATLPLLEADQPTLLARLSGSTLTTVVVRKAVLCVYRCAEMLADATRLEPEALLEEIYPALAYYQDTWQESLHQIRLAGLGARLEEFRRPLERELGCPVQPVLASAALEEPLAGEAKALVDRHCEALIGWMMNRGA
jgi:type IV pilus assembly protein PilM